MRPHVYYNENNSHAAQWLRNLVARELIPDGDVDERSIADVQPGDLTGYTHCHFFAGIGGWAEALRLARWSPSRPVWTGSCPCQPLSVAGPRTGHLDQRHLWPVFYRLIAECQPPSIFGEQSASKDGREWLSGVRLDLEKAGYACGAANLCAASKGAPHPRQRAYWVAYADGGNPSAERLQRSRKHGQLAQDGRCAQGMANARHQPAGRPARSGETEGRRPFGDASGCGAYAQWNGPTEIIQCRDGVRRVPGRPKNIESSICLLADGFWYRMADVCAEWAAQAINEVLIYAGNCGANASKVLRMVQERVCPQALSANKCAPMGAHGGLISLSAEEVLQHPLWDFLAARAQSSFDGRREQEKITISDARMLRDLQRIVSVEYSSLRRESDEQCIRQSSDALFVLSQFLARCCEKIWAYPGGQNAPTVLVGKVKGRPKMIHGYGNAIVPQVAAEFILAAEDARMAR